MVKENSRLLCCRQSIATLSYRYKKEANMSSPHTHHLKDYQVYPFEVQSVALHFDLEPERTRVEASLVVQRRAGMPAETPMVLNGEHLQLEQIAVDGQVLSEQQYQLDDYCLTVSNLPESCTITTVVTINPSANTALSGLYVSGGNFCTQCEAEGFRRITYFPDRPDVMTTFAVTITADQEKYPHLLSNGNCLEQKVLANGRHQCSWHDPSLKPCYLFALVAGQFDVIEDSFITMSGREVALRVYVDPGYADQAQFAMQALQKSMRWDENTFNREYDLDVYMIVAVGDFNFGAMENKGLNIFNTKYVLAKPSTATDADYIGIEKVIAHEYFHNWSGNRVTLRDWFQITLKEGLTVLRDQLFTEDATSAAVARIDEVNVLRTHQFAQDAGSMAHPIRPESYVEINNFYTVTVYNKGAEIIRMIKTLLGDSVFFQAMDEYFARFDGQAVTTEDFVGVMEAISGKDLTQFKRWYSQAGTPELSISREVVNDQYQLHVKQHCAATADNSPKEPFVIPLAVGLLNQTGDDLVGTKVLEVNQAEQTFSLGEADESSHLSLLRHFSAPVRVNYNYSDDELLWLMQHDTDNFNRWEAGQQLFSRAILHLTQQEAASWQVSSALLDAYLTLAETESDLYYASRLLALPSTSYLLQQSEAGDVQKLFTARQFVLRAIAEHGGARLLQRYQALQPGSYAFTLEQIGRRALRSGLLGVLLAPTYLTTDEARTELAYQQFFHADNMTDKMGALAALNWSDSMQRDAALTNFYETHENEALVLDKWFLLQASLPQPQTLVRVKELTQHEKFSYRNPNRARALLGGFAQNLPCFHAVDGSGYQFLAEQVLIIDQTNGQLASRLLDPFTHASYLSAELQQKMLVALEQIAAAPKLSSDVYEVTERCIKACRADS